jgi:hypothetical protein
LKAARRIYEIEERLEGKFCKDFGDYFGRKAGEVILAKEGMLIVYLEELDCRAEEVERWWMDGRESGWVQV